MARRSTDLQTKEFEPIARSRVSSRRAEVDVMGSALASAVGGSHRSNRTETGLPAIVLRLSCVLPTEVYGWRWREDYCLALNTLKSELTFLPSGWDAKQRTHAEDQRRLVVSDV